MVLTGEHIVGVLATLTLMVAVGLYAGSKVKTAADFSTGGRQALKLAQNYPTLKQPLNHTPEPNQQHFRFHRFRVLQ